VTPLVKTCPFCAGDNIRVFRTSPQAFVVYCAECGGQQKAQFAPAAVEKWNRRTTAGIGRVIVLAVDFDKRHLPAEWKDAEPQEVQGEKE
jgi:hypothetical protein